MQKKGLEVLRDSKLSKSTAFTFEEKENFGLRGLLPYAISTQEIQKQRVIENIRRKESNIEKYIFLSALHGRNERLFYRTVIDYLPELLPIIYTPTVGEVCQQFSHIYRIDKGFYITPEDIGDIAEIMENWPEHDVRVIVVTDGSRILGLGDLGCKESFHYILQVLELLLHIVCLSCWIWAQTMRSYWMIYCIWDIHTKG